jgi:hypothetical protein
MSEVNQRENEQAPTIKDGLSVIVLPEVGKRGRFGELTPESEAEVLGRLNGFLEKLNEQGVDVVSVFDIETDTGRKVGGVVSTITETKKYAIVRKTKRNWD